MIVPNRRQKGKTHRTSPLHARLRRWRWRWGVYAIVLVLTFVAGGYVRARGWHWLAWEHTRSAMGAARVEAAQGMHATRLRLESILRAESLPVLSLDVKFKHLTRLEAKRAQALEDGFLRTSDDDFVPATLTCEGEPIRVKARLKGDRAAHVAGDKWSFRIKVKEDQRPFGMRCFSLHHPEMRWYLNEWSFLESVRRDGILAVRYRFVRLVFNGVDKGIYALEEHFSKELLEAHGRREGVIVALESQMSIPVPSFKRGGRRWNAWERRTQIRPIQAKDIRTYDTRHIDGDPALRAQRDEAVELFRAYQEGRRKASNVFDVRLMGRYMALIDLWQAWHAVVWTNTRYYYNPITARLEPIGFDAMALCGDDDRGLIASRVEDWYINGPLRDPRIARAYLRELRRVAQPEYLEGLRVALEPHFQRWRLALQREFPLEGNLNSAWRELSLRQEFLRSALRPEKMVIATAVGEPASAATGGGLVLHTVDIRGTALLPVEIVGFHVNGGPLVRAASVWKKRRQDGVWGCEDGSVGISPMDCEGTLVLATFRLPVAVGAADVQGRRQSAIQVVTRYPGQVRSLVSDVRMSPRRSAYGSDPVIPTASEALRRHRFLERTSSGAFRVRPGTWDVTGDLVLPREAALEVGPGTTLRFGPGGVLYATGPVHLRGQPGREVVLEPREDHWGGVVVVEAGTESVWEDVVVRRTTTPQRGGWILTGGVTCYKSAVCMTRVTFRGSAGEDALNVVHTQAVLADCAFFDCGSDAFDGDFVTGGIERCRFEDVAGDAIDVSGSTITIRHLTARRVTDKVISAGERSEVTAADLDIDHAGIAVASKDSSVARVTRATIRHAGIGLAAYVKKAVFGPAQIIADEIEFVEPEGRLVVQTGSSVLLDGVEQQAVSVDVRSLYAAKALED